MDDRAYTAPCCNTDCLQGWQSRPPKLGFTFLPCQGLSIQGSKRKSCICGLDSKSLFLTAWCSCVLQARLTDIGPRGGSALKNLPWDIFAPFTSFSAFLLTPGVGNFPQPKTRQKGEKGKREVCCSEWAARLQVGIAHISSTKQLISHKPGKRAQVLQTPQAVAGSVQPQLWGRSRRVGQLCCGWGGRGAHHARDRPGEGTRAGKEAFHRVHNLLCN